MVDTVNFYSDERLFLSSALILLLTESTKSSRQGTESALPHRLMLAAEPQPSGLAGRGWYLAQGPVQSRHWEGEQPLPTHNPHTLREAASLSFCDFSGRDNLSPDRERKFISMCIELPCLARCLGRAEFWPSPSSHLPGPAGRGAGDSSVPHLLPVGCTENSTNASLTEKKRTL